MGTQNFIESSKLSGEPDEQGRFLIRVIQEGMGSSAYYSKEMLRENSHALNDALSFVNHPADPEKPWDRTFLDIVGRIDGELWYEEDEAGKGALWAYYLPGRGFADTIREYAPHIGLSIYTVGDSRRTEEGYVEALNFDPDYPYKSVDVVIAPGAGGGFEQFLESYRKVTSENPGANAAQENNRKETDMDFEELKATLSQISDSLAALATEKVAAVESEVTIEIVEEARKEAREQALASARALADADLAKSQIATIEAQILAGEDVAPLIESAKAVAEELREAAVTGSATGRVFGESKTGLAVSDSVRTKWSNR